MKYFVEEAHTKNEWIWKRRHVMQLSIILTALLFILVFVAIFIGANYKISPLWGWPIALIIFLIVYCGIGQMLGKFYDIQKQWYIAKFRGKKVEIEEVGGIQILKIPK
jgi:hypothetical protein